MAIKVGLIGAGAQGSAHLRAYRTIPDVEVVGVCDADPARLETVRRDFGIERLEVDHRRLLDAELDLVSVATMPVTHHELTVDALEAGSNVLCEKPMAMNAGEATRMTQAATRVGRFLAVGCNMRHMGSAQYLKRFAAEGRLGKALYTRTWSFFTEIPWWGKHYIKEIAGGGVAAADAAHVLDLALWIAGHGEPTRVSASAARVFPRKRASTAPSPEAASSYDVEDIAAAHVRFADGSWMTIELGWGWDRLDSSYSFEIVGELATIELDPLRVTAEQDGRPVDLTPAGAADADWDTSVRRGIEDVVDAVRQGREPLVRGEEAITVHRIVDALYRSVAEGREVAID